MRVKCLFQGHNSAPWRGIEPGTLGLESRSLPLGHWCNTWKRKKERKEITHSVWTVCGWVTGELTKNQSRGTLPLLTSCLLYWSLAPCCRYPFSACTGSVAQCLGWRLTTLSSIRGALKISCSVATCSAWYRSQTLGIPVSWNCRAPRLPPLQSQVACWPLQEQKNVNVFWVHSVVLTKKQQTVMMAICLIRKVSSTKP